MTMPLHGRIHHLDPLLPHLFRLVPVVPGAILFRTVLFEKTVFRHLPRGLGDGTLGEHQVHVRLFDVVLGQRSMDGQRVRESLPHQLPGHFTCKLLPLGRIELTRQGDLQLRVGAAIGAFVRIGGRPERVWIGLGELGHIARFD